MISRERGRPPTLRPWPPDTSRAYLDTRSAAYLLGVHEETLRQWARRGKIPAGRAGGGYRFRRSVLVAWLEGEGREGNGSPAQAV